MIQVMLRMLRRRSEGWLGIELAIFTMFSCFIWNIGTCNNFGFNFI